MTTSREHPTAPTATADQHVQPPRGRTAARPERVAARDEVAVLFARALEGDRDAEWKLGDRAFAGPRPERAALVAYLALCAPDYQRDEQAGWPEQPRLTTSQQDLADARLRDRVAAALARQASP